MPSPVRAAGSCAGVVPGKLHFPYGGCFPLSACTSHQVESGTKRDLGDVPEDLVVVPLEPIGAANHRFPIRLLQRTDPEHQTVPKDFLATVIDERAVVECGRSVGIRAGVT